MNAKIKILMDNAAFEDQPATELARILRNLAEKIESGTCACTLYDLNGNSVGRFEVSK